MSKFFSARKGSKFFLPVMLLLLALSAFGCKDESKEAEAVKAPAGPSFAVLNIDQVYENSKLTKAGMAHLEGVNAKFQAELTNMQKQMMDKQGDTEFQAAMQLKFSQMQEDIEKEQNRAAALISEALDDTLEAMRVEMKLDAVFHKQALLAAAPALDITDKFIQRFDTVAIDFAAAQPKKKAQEASETPKAAEDDTK